jgi:hypothetical protein
MGHSFWFASNATWPFAFLEASPDSISITLSFFGVFKKKFEFAKSEIRSVKRKKGILPFNTGIIVEHQKQEYPPFILFWTFVYPKLAAELSRLGFTITDK